MKRKGRKKNVLPGFGLSLGITLLYLSLIVMIPLSLVFFESSQAWMGEIYRDSDK